MWYNREAVHHTQLTEVINPYNPISQQFFQTMGSFGLSEEQTASYIARQITAQGFIIGANEIFLVSAITFISLVVLIGLLNHRSVANIKNIQKNNRTLMMFKSAVGFSSLLPKCLLGISRYENL